MNLQDMTERAYRVSSIVRICACSLDAEAPQAPGDEAATACTLSIADGLLGDVIDGLEALTKAPDQPEDSPAPLLRQWQAVRAQKKSMVALNGGDDPENCAEWDSLATQESTLGQRIADAKPQTNADAAAMLQWVGEDSCQGEGVDPAHFTAQQTVIQYLTEGATS